MKKYEYKVISIYDRTDIDLERKINKWAEYGYKLISINGDYIYIFEREIIKDNNGEINI